MSEPVRLDQVSAGQAQPCVATDPRKLGFDVSVPNVARIYDYLLGGKDNYDADRCAARRLLAGVPDAGQAALDNREFLGRAVRFLAEEAGIDQFLDIGTGLPTRGHVHDVLRSACPDAHVIYADHDPVVVAHARALLAGMPYVAVVEADVRYPGHLLTMREVCELIEFGRPVAVLLVAILHFVTNAENPWELVRFISRHLAPGSYLVVSHVTGDDIGHWERQRARDAYADASASGTDRTYEDIENFFSPGLQLIPPGLVNVAAWRTVRPARRTLFYAGIGRKLAGGE